MNELQKSKDKTENSDQNMLVIQEQNPSHITQRDMCGPVTQSALQTLEWEHKKISGEPFLGRKGKTDENFEMIIQTYEILIMEQARQIK